MSQEYESQLSIAMNRCSCQLNDEFVRPSNYDQVQYEEVC